MTRPRPLLDRARIGAAVERLGAEIAADHPDGVVLVGVLKGASILLADLARAVRGPAVTVTCMAISRFAPDSGRVRILHDVDIDVTGCDVVLVEDLVDTGLTADFLVRSLRERGARRVAVCALLDRSVRRIVPLEVAYRGFEVDASFIVGYGLHVRDRYRNLPDIHVVDRDVVLADPDAYASALYGDPA
ncbi:MAG: phosphoribosyltransferase [Actinomycetes bacterium]